MPFCGTAASIELTPHCGSEIVSYTGAKDIHRDGRGDSAEVMIRFRPVRGPTTVGFSSEAQRYLNSTFGADHAGRGSDVWRSVVKALQAGECRLAKRPEIQANTFRAEQPFTGRG